MGIFAPETSSNSDTEIQSSECPLYSGPTVIDDTPSDSDSESEHYPDPQNDNYSDSLDSDATADLFNDAFDEGTDPSEGNNQDNDPDAEEDYSCSPYDPLLDNDHQWCLDNDYLDYDDTYVRYTDEDATEQEEFNEAGATGTEEDYSSYPHTDPLIDNYRQSCLENNVPDYEPNYDGDMDEDDPEQEEFNEAAATGTEEYFGGLPSNQDTNPDANRRHLRQNVSKLSRKYKKKLA